MHTRRIDCNDGRFAVTHRNLNHRFDIRRQMNMMTFAFHEALRSNGIEISRRRAMI
jgi:hypothetical protein